MRCVIIEDEQHAAAHLEFMLKQLVPDILIEAKIDSIKGAIQWLSQHDTELIFLDVQLGDGISFSIFDNVQVITPVVFTTSYDQYAIAAFKTNSIDYLLKPIHREDLKAALSKYESLYGATASLNELSRTVNKFQKRFLVTIGNTVRAIAVEDIAYFMVQNRHVFIVLNTGEQLLFDTTLDALESRLDTDSFFRINRQFIVHISAIHKMFNETRGRVRIEVNPSSKEEMIVSIDRASDFKKWLDR